MCCNITVKFIHSITFHFAVIPHFITKQYKILHFSYSSQPAFKSSTANLIIRLSWGNPPIIYHSLTVSIYLSLTWASLKMNVTGLIKGTELRDMMEADRMLLLIEEESSVLIRSSMFWYTNTTTLVNPIKRHLNYSSGFSK